MPAGRIAGRRQSGWARTVTRFPSTPKPIGPTSTSDHFAKNSPAPGPTGNPSAIQPVSISVQARRNATE